MKNYKVNSTAIVFSVGGVEYNSTYGGVVTLDENETTTRALIVRGCISPMEKTPKEEFLPVKTPAEEPPVEQPPVTPEDAPAEEPPIENKKTTKK